MKHIAEVRWFLFCGARERLGKTGAFGLAGTCVAVGSDVLGSRKDRVWVAGSLFLGFGILSLLAILLLARKHRPLTTLQGKKSTKRATRTRPIALPMKLHVSRDLALFGLLSATQLFATGLGQTWVGSRSDPTDGRSVSLFADLIPELRILRREVTGVRESLERVEHTLGDVKRETSSDPRKELASMGLSWTADAFFEAIRRGDLRSLRLFTAGDMTTAAPDSQGRSLPEMLARNTQNAPEVLDVLVAGGLDVNDTYPSGARMGGGRTTLLGRAIEMNNLALVEALVRHQARMNDLIQTFGSFGVAQDTYPVASALYWQHVDIAESLLNAGADAGVGDYAAYREAQALRKKPGLPPEMTTRLGALLVRLAPKGDAQERIAAELRLQAVEEQLIQVALQGFRALRDSSEKTRLDHEYDALQVERSRLRAQLGIQGK